MLRVMVLLMLAPPVLAQWWFVAPYGNDKHSGQQLDKPLFSIQKALQLAQPGDQVSLLPGAYYQNFQSVRPGTVQKPITISGNQRTVIYGAKNAHIVDINHSYIVLQNFTLNGKHGGGDKVEDHRNKLLYIASLSELPLQQIVVRNLTFKNALGECLRLKNAVQHSEIAHNDFYRCGLYDYHFGRNKKNGEAIYVGTAPEQLEPQKTKLLDNSSHNHIHQNLIEVLGSECKDVKEGANYNLIENNICTGALDAQSGAISLRGNHNTVRNNEISNNRGAGIRLGGDSPADGIHNSVYRNRFNNNQQGAIKLMAWPQQQICDNHISQSKQWPFYRFGKNIKQTINGPCL